MNWCCEFVLYCMFWVVNSFWWKDNTCMMQDCDFCSGQSALISKQPVDGEKRIDYHLIGLISLIEISKRSQRSYFCKWVRTPPPLWLGFMFFFVAAKRWKIHCLHKSQVCVDWCALCREIKSISKSVLQVQKQTKKTTV